MSFIYNFLKSLRTTILEKTLFDSFKVMSKILFQSQIQNCDDCNFLVSPDGQGKKMGAPPTEEELHPKLAEKDRQIRELELELAQTKLALVESECKTQDLTHQLNSALTEIQASKNTWFQKTITSLREATAKKDGKDGVIPPPSKESLSKQNSLKD